MEEHENLWLEMQENGLAALVEDGELIYEDLNPLEARDILYLVKEHNISLDWNVLERYLPEYPRNPIPEPAGEAPAKKKRSKK